MRAIIAALRSRIGARFGRQAAPTPADPPCDVLLHPSVADDSAGPGEACFRALFKSQPHRSSWPHAQLDAEIRSRAAAIHKRQPGYQPVYGFADEFPAKRVSHLERNVQIVLDAVGDEVSKHQVRIVDIGCNNGYVALRLAESMPGVVGLEVEPTNLALCRLLAARHESPARFFADNAFDWIDTDSADLEQVDVVLLYNVVHQFIFRYGFERTRQVLARLASRVDTVIVELAHRADYESRGQGHLLPQDPAEVLALCENVDIALLHAKPRPVYRLKRRTVRLGELEIRPEAVRYSLHPDSRVSRKYYAGDGRFLKLLRFDDPAERAIFDREVAGLTSLQGCGIAPDLLGSASGAHWGAVLMSRADGGSLSQIIYRQTQRKLAQDERLRLTCQYLEISRTIHERLGYHNDLQPHNLMWQHRSHLIAVDFEQAGRAPTNDPFGLLLWTVFDIWGGRDKGRPAAIRSLRLRSDDELRKTPVYPEFSGLTLPTVVADMVAAARTGGDWGDFLGQWVAQMQAAASTRVVAP